jgi:hypothetical protein
MAHLPIMQVDCFPVGIISRIKRSAINVKLIAEDELKLYGRICIGRFRIRRLGSVGVYKTPVSSNGWDLSGGRGD